MQPAKERRLDTFSLREEVLDIMKPLKEMLNPALFPVVSILTWCPVRFCPMSAPASCSCVSALPFSIAKPG